MRKWCDAFLDSAEDADPHQHVATSKLVNRVFFGVFFFCKVYCKLFPDPHLSKGKKYTKTKDKVLALKQSLQSL